MLSPFPGMNPYLENPERRQPKSSQYAIATLTPAVEPISVTLPMAEEVQERYLEIREGSVLSGYRLYKTCPATCT